MDSSWPYPIRIITLLTLYGIPALQILLTISGEYRKLGIISERFPYCEHSAVASDIVYTLLSSFPLYLIITGKVIDAAIFLIYFVPCQYLWLKKRIAAWRKSGIDNAAPGAPD